MIKSIIKETFIMLLLCTAIVLVLGIIFYDYIPSNRVIPTREAYVSPENVRSEIDAQITELEKTEVSYEITDSDLNLYKQTSSYKPGKSDPFSLEEESVANNTSSTNNTTSTSTGSSSGGQNSSSSKNDSSNNDNDTKNNDKDSNSEKTNTDKNSTGTFFNDEGMK